MKTIVCVRLGDRLQCPKCGSKLLSADRVWVGCPASGIDIGFDLTDGECECLEGGWGQSDVRITLLVTCRRCADDDTLPADDGRRELHLFSDGRLRVEQAADKSYTALLVWDDDV